MTIKKHVAAMLLGCSAATLTALLVPASPAQAIPVFDATNYAQNILQAARALRQVNQQIQSLQNEAAMLTRLDKNLSKISFPELDALKERLQKIDTLMRQANAIDFRVDGLDDKLKAMFPESFDAALRSDTRVADAKARLDSAMQTFRQAMGVQARVVANVRDDAETLSTLIARSQGAEGGLQAAQATNQILALATKQQFQLQSMMAAEYRSAGLERARRAQAESEARAMTRKFIGSGSAYRLRGRYYIVDRLFEAAELRLGAKPQKIVRISLGLRKERRRG